MYILVSYLVYVALVLALGMLLFGISVVALVIEVVGEGLARVARELADRAADFASAMIARSRPALKPLARVMSFRLGDRLRKASAVGAGVPSSAKAA